MISAAIIGCGAIARKRHAPACASHRDVGLSGFYDPAVQNAEDLAKRYGGKTYGSREELLSDEKVDAVIVCVPERFHCETVIECLEAGKHVLCEKPMAMNVEEARRMFRAWKESGKILSVAFSQRFYPEYRIAKKMIREGAIGRVLMFRTCLANSGVENFVYGNPEDFYDTQIQNVGGVMSNVGCHRVDLIRYLLEREIVQVFSYTPVLDKRFRDGRPIDREDTALSILKLEGGVTGMLWSSWYNYGGPDAGTRIFGTEGALEISADGNVTIEKKDGTKIRVEIEKREEEENGFSVTERFLDSILEGLPTSPDGKDGLICMEVLDAIERSNRSGTWESVNSAWETGAVDKNEPKEEKG